MRRGKRSLNKFDILQILIVLALLVFMIVMLVSGNSRVVPMSEIEAVMDAEPSVAELTKKTLQDAAKTFDLDPTAVEEAVYYRVDDVMNVNELFIARISDDDSREAVVSAVKKYLEEKTESFDGYGTNQYGLLSSAVVTEKGPYLFFGVSEDVLQWESDFLACIR